MGKFENLLEEAKIKYPIGTEFYSLPEGGRKKKCKATVHPHGGSTWIAVHPEGAGGVCWYNGEWAEIIKPKNSITNDYQIF